MAVSHAHAEFGEWSADGHILRIEYAIPVLEEICADAVEGLYRFRHGGMEVGGVLFGEAAGDTVRVLAYRPLECEHAYGPRFVLSDRDRARLKDLLYAGQRDDLLCRLEPVGWYHSHTRSGLELSPRDLEIYDAYFPQRWQIAAVARPDNYGTARVAFFVRGRDNLAQGGPALREILIRPRRGFQAMAEPDEPLSAAPEPLAVEREPEPEAPRAQEMEASAPPARSVYPWVLDEPAEGSAEPRTPDLPGFVRVHTAKGKKLIWGAVAILAALLGAAGFGIARYYRDASPPEPLLLWVADMGGQLQIEWDRTSRPVRDARAATLEILDGKERNEIQMEGDRLREGSVDYVRRSDIVDVRLKVLWGDRETEEFIRFVGPPVRRGPSQEEAELMRQNEALKAEVAGLRAELEARNARVRRARPAAPARGR